MHIVRDIYMLRFQIMSSQPNTFIVVEYDTDPFENNKQKRRNIRTQLCGAINVTKDHLYACKNIHKHCH